MLYYKNLIEIINRTPIETIESDGLMNGKLGVAYFYYYLYKISENEEYLKILENILTQVFERIESQESNLLASPFLKDGISGFGYLLQFLVNEEILDKEFLLQLENINDLVYENAITLLNDENYDFVDGPIGILYYLNYVGCDNYVQKIVDLIYAKLIKNENFMFYNNYHYLEGIHFGYAHGIPAIIKVLDEIEDVSGKCEYIIKDLLSKLKDTIISNEEYINGYRYYLPRSIHKPHIYDGEINFRAVLAWSNSDLNFSTLVYSLKPKYFTNELKELADEIALESIHRKNSEQTRIFDYRLFFGSSGVLQMYNYLYRKTKNEIYLDACEFWSKKTIDLIQSTNNIIEEHELDFLNNLPGAILSLIESKSENSLNWSKLYLL